MNSTLPLFTITEPEFSILFQEEHWLAVVKPRGLPAVPSPLREQSLLEVLKEHGYKGVRTVGRLDRAAGGVTVLARDQEGQRLLTTFWHHPSTTKVYLAGTYAPPDPPTGEVKLAIGPGRRHNAMRLGKGKVACTRYRLVGRSPKGHHWVEAIPLTGRRHQIRLHLGSRGAPIVGDTLYLPFFAKQFPDRLRHLKITSPKPPERIELYCLCVSIRALGIYAVWQGVISQQPLPTSMNKASTGFIPDLLPKRKG